MSRGQATPIPNHCKKCMYRSSGADSICQYALMTGKLRGCPAGEGCVHKATGQKPRNACNLPEHKDDPTNRAALNKAYQQSHKAELAQYQREFRAKRKAAKLVEQSAAQ